jgi:hypothetical protein
MKFDCGLDLYPVFDFDADPFPAFDFDADSDPVSQNVIGTDLQIRIRITGLNTVKVQF